MTIAEYAGMDMQWYEEARTAVTAYRQGQEAAITAKAARDSMKAG